MIQGVHLFRCYHIDGIKSRYSKYLNHKYGTAEFLRRNKVTIEEVSTLNEGLEKAIAYTQMNCVAANICFPRSRRSPSARSNGVSAPMSIKSPA